MKDHLTRFGERVRQLRVAAGLSQEQLADRCHLHRTYIGGVERGERNVGLLNVYAIAAALREPIENLFCDRTPSGQKTAPNVKSGKLRNDQTS
jgi:transcriptional regulator with XRE-family HTH domain